MVGEFGRSPIPDPRSLIPDPCSLIERLRQPKVEDLHRAVGTDLDIGRLQIAMDNPVLVCRVERIGDLSGDRQGFGKGNRATRDAPGQVLALGQLHDERVKVRALLDAVDLRDVRMVKCCERFGLAIEAGQSFGVVGERLGQHLQCDVAIEPRVTGVINLSHSAGADGGTDFERPESRAGPYVHVELRRDYTPRQVDRIVQRFRSGETAA